MKLKQMKNWLFRETLELDKKWWHRLIKVIFLSIFSLTIIGSYAALMYEPDISFLRKHNISIRNTLYEFTRDYTGPENDNTVPLFYKQDGRFGILLNDKIKYNSLYSLGKSFCLREPQNYKESIMAILYTKYKNDLPYGKEPVTLETFNKDLSEDLFKDPARKCFLYDKNEEYDEDLKQADSSMIINFRPNILFYIEATLAVLIISFVSFLLFALFYYHLILYIIFGNKK